MALESFGGKKVDDKEKARVMADAQNAAQSFFSEHSKELGRRVGEGDAELEGYRYDITKIISNLSDEELRKMYLQIAEQSNLAQERMDEWVAEHPTMTLHEQQEENIRSGSAKLAVERHELEKTMHERGLFGKK